MLKFTFVGTFNLLAVEERSPSELESFATTNVKLIAVLYCAAL